MRTTFGGSATVSEAAHLIQQELHGGCVSQAQRPPALASNSLGGHLPSWPGGLPGSMQDHIGGCGGSSSYAPASGFETAFPDSLYSLLMAGRRGGRPPLHGGSTNRLSAPADLQQELRNFALGGRTSSCSAGIGGGGSGSECGAFGSEQPLDATRVQQQKYNTAPGRVDRVGSMSQPRSGGSSYIPGVPSTATNITEYAASLIGFDGLGGGRQGSGPAAAGGGGWGVDAGLGLGGSGLSTHSMPLMSGYGGAVGPFQEGECGGAAAWPLLGASSGTYSGLHPATLASLGRSASVPDAHHGVRPQGGGYGCSPRSPSMGALHQLSYALPTSPLAASRSRRGCAGGSGDAAVGELSHSLSPPPAWQRHQRQRRGRCSRRSSAADASNDEWQPDGEADVDMGGFCGGSGGGDRRRADRSVGRNSWHAEVAAAGAAADAAELAGDRPKVGRPRKYDLSGDLSSSGAEGKGGGSHRKGGRTKYASKAEALARRRERNRASALEAYYRGKARRATLEVQLRALKEEDAALHALAAVAEQDLDTGVRVRELLSSGIAAPEVLRRLHTGQ